MANGNMENENLDNENPENKNLDSESISMDDNGGLQILDMLKEAIVHAGFELDIDGYSPMKPHLVYVQKFWDVPKYDSLVIPNHIVCGLVNAVSEELEQYEAYNIVVYDIVVAGVPTAIQFGKVGVGVLLKVARSMFMGRKESEQEDSPAQ